MIRLYVQIYPKNQMRPSVQVHVPLPAVPRNEKEIPWFVMERLTKHGVTPAQVKKILAGLHKPGSKIRVHTPQHDVVVEILP